MTAAKTYTIRPFAPSDAALYRDLRLAALQDTPAAFSSSFEEESRLSVDEFRDRIPVDSRSATFGVFDGTTPVGMAGLEVSERVRTRHLAYLWGVYVAPGNRGAGLGARLVEAVIERARGQVILLHCGVAMTNQPARRVYHALGFRPYGVEPKAILVDGIYYDEEQLVLDLSV